MLYAFRQGFYARLGYVQAPAQRRLSIAPRAFASFATGGLGRDHQLRIATGDDLPRLRELHEIEAKRHTGWVLRTETSWLRLLADERITVLVAVRNGVTRGAIFTALEQDEPHARTALRVDDLLAEDAAARAALYAHLYAQRDQAGEILLETPEGDPLELALIDADGHVFGDRDVEHPLGVVGSGPMLRLLDPARALAARGYPAAKADALILDIDGRTLAVHAGGGTQARVEDTRAPADLRLDARALTAMAFGSWKASQLAELGWTEALTPSAIERADRLFALAPFFSRDPF
jgi:predicted acetyltransferase